MVITKGWLSLILAVALLLYVILSVVLVYHWRRYGLGQRSVWLAELIYFIMTLLLIALASWSLLIY